MTTLIEKVEGIVKNTYDQMYPEEAESARERGQRIRRAEERVLSEKPQWSKWIDRIKSKGDIERYGIPAGAEPVDKEEGYEEDEEPQEPRESLRAFTYKTIGGDMGLAGKTKFRRWLENVFLEDPERKDLKEKIDGASGKTKRNMMRTISYVVRRKIAADGLEAGWVKGGAGTWVKGGYK